MLAWTHRGSIQYWNLKDLLFGNSSVVLVWSPIATFRLQNLVAWPDLAAICYHFQKFCDIPFYCHSISFSSQNLATSLETICWPCLSLPNVWHYQNCPIITDSVTVRFQHGKNLASIKWLPILNCYAVEHVVGEIFAISKQSFLLWF